MNTDRPRRLSKYAPDNAKTIHATIHQSGRALGVNADRDSSGKSQRSPKHGLAPARR
jgi:hypothetical protein